MLFFMLLYVLPSKSGKFWWMFLDHLFSHILPRQFGASLTFGETVKQGMYAHQAVTGGHHVRKTLLVSKIKNSLVKMSKI